MAWTWQHWQGAHIAFSAENGGHLYDQNGEKILNAVTIEGDDPHIEVRDAGVARSMELLPQYIRKLKSLTNQMRAVLSMPEVFSDERYAVWSETVQECEKLVGEINWILPTDY